MPGGLFYVFILTGPDAATAISAELLSLYMLHRFKSTKALFWTFAPVLIVVQYLFLSMNGNSEGDILAFLLVPVAAVIVFGPERSWKWFWACIIPLGTAPFLESWLPHWTSALALTAGTACLYILVYSLYKQLLGASRVIAAQKEEIEREHQRAEKLLSNMLPVSVAKQLKANPDKTISDDLAAVSILFADIVGFTALSSQHSAPELVTLLNTIFSRFDTLVDVEKLEKIKTIGDAYMVASGAPSQRADHAVAVVRLGLAMQAEIALIAAETGKDLSLRIGIASGPATAGVIGTRKPFYDIWGDTVNMASRMESTGVAGRTQIAQSTMALLEGAFVLEDRGAISVKGKEKCRTWFLNMT